MGHVRVNDAASDEMASAGSSIDYEFFETFDADTDAAASVTNTDSAASQISESILPAPSFLLPAAVAPPTTPRVTTLPRPLPATPVRAPRRSPGDPPSISKVRELANSLREAVPAQLRLPPPIGAIDLTDTRAFLPNVPPPAPTWESIKIAIAEGGDARRAEMLAADAKALLQAEEQQIVEDIVAAGGRRAGLRALIVEALNDPQLKAGPTRELLESELATVRGAPLAVDGRSGRRSGSRSELLADALHNRDKKKDHLVKLLSHYELPPAPLCATPAELPFLLHRPNASTLTALRSLVARGAQEVAEYTASARQRSIDELQESLLPKQQQIVKSRIREEVSTARVKAFPLCVERVWRTALLGEQSSAQADPPARPLPADGWIRLKRMLSEKGDNVLTCEELLTDLLRAHAAGFVPSGAVEYEYLEKLLRGPKEPAKDSAATLFENALGVNGPPCSLSKIVNLPLPRPTVSLPEKYRGCFAVALRDGEGLPALRALLELVHSTAEVAVEAIRAAYLGLRQLLIKEFGESLSDDVTEKNISSRRRSHASSERRKNRAPVMINFLEAAMRTPSSSMSDS